MTPQIPHECFCSVDGVEYILFISICYYVAVKSIVSYALDLFVPFSYKHLSNQKP